MSKKTILSVFVVAVLVVGGFLTWYVSSNTSSTQTQPTIDTSNSLEGTLQSIDCTTAGAGCTDWVLKLSNGDAQGLVVNQDIKPYGNKKVRLTGQYVKTFGENGPTFFEVKSIQALE